MAHRNAVPEIWRGGGLFHPLREMNRMQRRMDRMFDHLLSEPFFGSMLPSRSLDSWMGVENQGFTPPCDLDETDTHYLVSFDLPGVKKEQLKVEIRDNQLVISGERKEEHKFEKANRLAEERIYGTFARSFTLPSSVHADQVDAQFENGVLRVMIPKTESSKPKQISIKEVKEGKEAKSIETKVA